MNTLEFLKTILPEDGVKYLALIDEQGRVAHKPFTSLEEMAAAVGKYDQQQVQVYHACASYLNDFVMIDGQKKYRKPPNWNRAKTFWLDIDCGEAKFAKGEGYLTKKDAYQALKEFCDKVGLSVPMIIDSGYGLHCYWVLTKSISAETWLKIATVLKAATLELGFIADQTGTADFSRILRPVGATNRKYGSAAPVVFKKQGELVDPKEFAKALFALNLNVAKPKPAETQDLNDDLTAHLAPPPNVPSYAEVVAEKCAQVAAMRDTQGDVNYEHWRGVIGIIKHCEEGIDLAYAWSARREETGHSQNDVDVKYNTWGSGPSTCEFFSKCNPSGCEGCQFKGKVKSPILLGRKEPEPEASEVEAVVDGREVIVEIPKIPKGFGYEENVMVAFVKDKDDITRAFAFCNTLFYPTHRICKANGEYGIGIRMHLPDNRTREFIFDTASLASNTETVKELAKYEIVGTNHKHANMYINAYLKASLEKLMREAEELNTHTSFGWQKDYQSFLIGDRLYHKDGTVRKVLVGGYAEDRLVQFPTPVGNIKAYSDALKFLYSRSGMEHMQYVVASTFGSILTPFCDTLYKGICFAMVSSKPGTGKTTACFTGLYGFGDANKLAIKSEQATINALYAQIGVNNQIPVLYDEVTNIKPEDLSKLCYAITSGQERQRLTTGNGNGTRFANSQTWEMVLFLTANTNLHALLASRQSNTEAEAVRLIQLDVDRYKLPDLEGEVETVMKRLQMNQGVAGELFVQHVVQNLDAVMERMAVWGSRIKKDIPDAKYRFYRSQAMTAMAALDVLNQLEITNWDTEAVYDFIKTLFFELANSVQEQNTVSSDDAFNRMMNDLTPRILVTDEYRDGRDSRGPEDGNRIIGAVAGRRIMGNNNTKNNPLAGKLYLIKKEITDWCLQERVDYKAMMSSIINDGIARDVREKFNVGRGTKVSAGQHRCIEIDMAKLEALDEAAPKLTIHTGGKVEDVAKTVNE